MFAETKKRKLLLRGGMHLRNSSFLYAVNEEERKKYREEIKKDTSASYEETDSIFLLFKKCDGIVRPASLGPVH